MAGTVFGWDVAVLKTTSTGHDFIDIFTDCGLTLDHETDRSRAAHDLAPASDGYDCDVQKSRSWSLRLGAVVQADAATTTAVPCRRMFGWDMVDLKVNGYSFLPSFTRCQVRVSNETVSARATHDTIATAIPLPPGQTVPGLGGWDYPHRAHRVLEIDIDGVVDGAAMNMFDLALTGWYPDPVYGGLVPDPGGTAKGFVTYELSGGGVTVAGNAIIAGGSLTYPQEGATQTIRLRAHGAPVVGPVMANDPGKLLEMAVANTVWQLQVTHPSLTAGKVYQGNAIVTEATFEAPDGAAMQGATFQGFGPLSISP